MPRMKKTDPEDWKSIRTKVAYAVDLLEEVENKLNTPKSIGEFNKSTVNKTKKLKNKLYSRSAREYPDKFGDKGQSRIEDFS